MRLLLDTNIVLDVLLDRQPFVNDATIIWEAHETGKLTAYVSAITPVNLFYIARKLRGREAAFAAVRMLLNTFPVAAVSQPVLESGLALSFRDFEDAVQYACATAQQLEAIVTRNTDDFATATLPVLSPAAFISEHANLLNSPQ